MISIFVVLDLREKGKGFSMALCCKFVENMIGLPLISNVKAASRSEIPLMNFYFYFFLSSYLSSFYFLFIYV